VVSRDFGKATTSVVPILTSGSAQFYWCREQDLNLHAFWALDPKSNASANSAIPACAYFN
jgi:hypothetical protein